MLLEIIALLLVAVVISQLLYLHYRHWTYSHIPGPPRPSFIFGHALQLRQRIKDDGCIGKYWLDLVREYGQIFNFWVITTAGICLADPHAIRDIVSDFKTFKRSSEHQREYFAEVFSFNSSRMGFVRFCGFHSLLTDDGGPIWKHKKKIMDPAFTTQRLSKQLDRFYDVAASLITAIEEAQAAHPGEIIDVDFMIAQTITDAISKVGFSANEGNVQSLRSVDPRGRQKALQEIVAKQFNRLTLMIDPVSRKKLFNAADDIKRVREVGRRMIMERTVDGKLGDVDDILDSVISANMKAGKVDIEECVDDFMAMYAAGTGTTKISLLWSLAELTRHPHIMEKLVAEIDKMWVPLGVNKDTHSDVIAETLKEMTYLDAFVKEILRFRPPTQLFRRFCTKNIKICGYDIPSYTLVVGSQYAMHRWEKFWDNPDVLDPERFLNSSPKPYTYIPFFLGPRQCIGKTFAHFELKTILCEVLGKFHLKRDESQPWEIRSMQALLCQPLDTKFHLSRRGTMAG